MLARQLPSPTPSGKEWGARTEDHRFALHDEGNYDCRVRAHKKKNEGGAVAHAVAIAISRASAEELDEVERVAADTLLKRRRELGQLSEGRGGSRVVAARAFGDGWLQAEVRTYRRKDGTETERGPYWYFRYHQDGGQKKLYLGKTDDPEGRLREKRALSRRGGRGRRDATGSEIGAEQGRLDIG